MDWFGNGVTIPLKTKDNTTVIFNGTELSSDTSADSYFNITYKTEYVAPNMVVTYNLEIKPGVEIGSDFFSKNQVQIISHRILSSPPKRLLPLKITEFQRSLIRLTICS